MILVIDSSVAIKWFVPEEGHAEALALLDLDAQLIAPDLLLAEVANSLWRKVRVGEISQRQMSAAIAELGSLLVFEPLTGALTVEAAGIASELRHSVYDCIFLAYALRRSAQLITADAKFLSKLSVGEKWNNVRALQMAG